MKLQITIDGRAYEVDVELLEEEEVLPDLRTSFEAPSRPPAIPFAQSYPVPVSADPKVCRSPVMGLAIKVNVEPGQMVEAGELIVVLESMKMESNVLAQAAGTVKAVHAKEGEPVKLNQPLVEFE